MPTETQGSFFQFIPNFKASYFWHSDSDKSPNPGSPAPDTLGLPHAPRLQQEEPQLQAWLEVGRKVLSLELH